MNVVIWQLEHRPREKALRNLVKKRVQVASPTEIFFQVSNALLSAGLTLDPHRVRQRITHHAPAHAWGWNPPAIMVVHTQFSVNTTTDKSDTHFGVL